MMMQPESESPAMKRPRLSSDRNVCIIVQGWHGSFNNVEYKFYILDRRDSYSGGDEFVHMKPTLVFKADFPAEAFCALNSTIYMFEGDFLGNCSRGKYAGKFEITPQILAGFDYELEKHNLVSIKPMHQTKNSPIALPTPDGKHILVFSSQFSRDERKKLYGDSFELYDVAENSWRACPPLPLNDSVTLLCYFRTEAYGFEGESQFRIRISGGLVFVLDLQSGKWERPISGLVPLVKGYFLGIDGFYFTPTYAYNKRCRAELEFHPPLSKFPDDDHDDVPMYVKQRERLMFFPYMALLGHDEDDGFYDMGAVRARRPPSKINGLNVILDVYSISTVRFKRDVEEHERHLDKYMEKYKGKYEGKREKRPLFKTTTTTVATKTLKRLIDFDAGTFVPWQMYLFSI